MTGSRPIPPPPYGLPLDVDGLLLSPRDREVLALLNKATVLFMGRLLIAIREGLSTREIAKVTGLPEPMVYKLVIAATEAQ